MRQETVLYDGDCGVCRYAVGRVSPSLPAGIVFRAHQSLSDAELTAAGTTRTACTQGVQFIHASGTVTSGGTACVDLLERSTTPLRRLATVARLPLIRTIVNFAYDRFAANRATISRTFKLEACAIVIPSAVEEPPRSP